MEKVIGVRFKRVGKIYYFLPGKIHLEAGDHAIVETARGTEYGDVVIADKEVEEKDLVAPLKQVIRRANSKDDKKVEENGRKEKEAFGTCQNKIESHGLEMKLVDVEYTFDNSKIVFYFTADGRVDFRDLVKDLAGVFKTRIELRQIGVRDEAKMLGGLGPCGRACCCSYFLGDFTPVSIKMAKEQNLSLSPTKISGLCGRLMCCLNYEYQHYHDTRKRMPRPGSIVDTPEGNGVAIENNAITEKVRVKITLPDESFDIKFFDLTEITVIKSYEKPKNKPKNKQGGKPNGRPGGKPGGKPNGRPGGKPGDKPNGKPDNKPQSSQSADTDKQDSGKDEGHLEKNVKEPLG